MKKIIAVALAASLAACAAEADAPAEDDAMGEEETAAVEGPIGNYTMTNDAGDPMSAVIAADGTTQIMNADGETVDSGTWEQVGAESCFVMENMEEGSDPYCVTFGEPSEDGTIEITDSEGDVNTVTLVS